MMVISYIAAIPSPDLLTTTIRQGLMMQSHNRTNSYILSALAGVEKYVRVRRLVALAETFWFLQSWLV